MSASALGLDAAWAVGGTLTETATVRTRGAGGDFSAVATRDLACRLLHVTPTPAATARDRAELAAVRRLIFDPAYFLPTPCQIEVRGQRWRPTDNRTIATYRDLDGTAVYAAVDVVRAD